MTTLDLDALERAARDLQRQTECYQCNCIACDREGMGELHDHVCTGGDGCKKTAEKLEGRRRALSRKCRDAGTTILALISDFRALQERVEGAEKVISKFEAHYPMGINPYLDEASRAARAHFAARTKAGEPHEQE